MSRFLSDRTWADEKSRNGLVLPRNLQLFQPRSLVIPLRGPDFLNAIQRPARLEHLRPAFRRIYFMGRFDRYPKDRMEVLHRLHASCRYSMGPPLLL